TGGVGDRPGHGRRTPPGGHLGHPRPRRHRLLLPAFPGDHAAVRRDRAAAGGGRRPAARRCHRQADGQGVTRRAVISAALAALLAAGVATAARAQDETPKLPRERWSFSGPFGALDLAAAQRGFQVYNDVCAACHSMNLLHYRDLSGIGLTEEQIKAAAASFGGSYPPDQSVLVNAREGGPDYIYAILTGYTDPPPGFKLAEGLY